MKNIRCQAQSYDSIEIGYMVCILLTLVYEWFDYNLRIPSTGLIHSLWIYNKIYIILYVI